MQFNTESIDVQFLFDSLIYEPSLIMEDTFDNNIFFDESIGTDIEMNDNIYKVTTSSVSTITDKMITESEERKGKVKGRKINKKLFELDRTHNKYSNDNMIRKIKSGFHQFLLVFLNNCIEVEKLDNIKLKSLDGKITQSTSIEFNKELLKLSLKEFFSMKVRNFKESKKYHNNYNKEIIDFICNNNQSLNELLGNNYREVFEELYLNKNIAILFKEEYEKCFEEAEYFIKCSVDKRG